MGLQKSRFRKNQESPRFGKLGETFHKKDIDAQVAVFNEIILNVFRNYVPNKFISIDDKYPVRMNETIELKIKAKKAICTTNTFKTEDQKVAFCFLRL